VRNRAHRRDVVVVGGGVYGASILFHLASDAVDAMLLERRHLADGPTGRSSGNVRLHYTTAQLAEIARRSFELMDRFGEIVGGDSGFMRVGVLYGVQPEDAAQFEASVGRLAAAGEPIETRTVAEMAELVPDFDLGGIALGVWEPRSGYADPVGTTRGFADAARALGSEIRVTTAVVRLLVDSGRVAGVELSDGSTVHADRVVVAAGPWSRPLLGTAGIGLPTYPERHAITLVATPDGRSRQVVPCVWSDRIRRYYARPEGDSLVLLGGVTSKTKRISDADAYDERVSLTEASEHVERAAPRIPALGTLGIRPGYAGVYDMSPDGFPIVDEVPGVRGLFVMAGTSGHGFKLAPALGRLVSELVRGHRSPLLAPFRFDRDFAPTGELSA
jgi:glycine/D-amino acid oxidase-like deaminating enzyme